MRHLRTLPGDPPFEMEFVPVYPRIFLLALVASIGIPTAAAQESTAATAVAPATVERPARIRLIGQNGIYLTMFTNAHCGNAYEEEIEGSGALSLNFKALVGKRRPNDSLGIPQTETTRTLEDRNWLRAYPYYSEFPLVPGQPVALQAQIAPGGRLSCGHGKGPMISFVPEAGVDYEGDMVGDLNTMTCGIAVRRVSADGSLSGVPVNVPPKKCKAPTRPAAPVMVMLFDPGLLQYRLAEEDADIEELDNDDDSVEDFEEMMHEAPLAAGVSVCIVADDAFDGSELGKQLPALLQARGVSDRVQRFRTKALEAEWGLTEEHPLNFALAEFYCHSVVGSR